MSADRRDAADLRDVDRELAGALVAPIPRNTMALIRQKAGDANWLFGAVALLVVAGLMVFGLLRESAFYSLHRQTCDGVMRSGALDQPKLDFLSKHCVPPR